jgi:hypothetical protein
MKKLLIFSLILSLFIGLQQLIELSTRGFYLEKILASDLITDSAWDSGQQEEIPILEICKQPFTFLGAGSECFAFLSQDQTTVIKFFKVDLFRPVYFFRGLFFENYSSYAGTISRLNYPLIKRVLGMREYRIARTWNSLKLSYDHLKEETGLLYLHLNPSEHLHKKVTLYDPNHIAHTIDLDTTRFYVQKRATPLVTHLLQLKEEGEHARAQACVASFCKLILDRCQKGFADRDPYMKNFGFIGDRAVELDTGSFIRDERMKEARFYKQELLFTTRELKTWAAKHYPQLSGFIEQQLLSIYS